MNANSDYDTISFLDPYAPRLMFVSQSTPTSVTTEANVFSQEGQTLSPVQNDNQETHVVTCEPYSTGVNTVVTTEHSVQQENVSVQTDNFDYVTMDLTSTDHATIQTYGVPSRQSVRFQDHIASNATFTSAPRSTHNVSMHTLTTVPCTNSTGGMPTLGGNLNTVQATNIPIITAKASDNGHRPVNGESRFVVPELSGSSQENSLYYRPGFGVQTPINQGLPTTAGHQSITSDSLQLLKHEYDTLMAKISAHSTWKHNVFPVLNLEEKPQRPVTIPSNRDFSVPTCTRANSAGANIHDFVHGSFNPSDYNHSSRNNKYGYKPVIYPDKFDGTSNKWREYICHFETCASINAWTEEQKAMWLMGCLKGKAASILINHPNRVWSFDELKTVLNLRFGPARQPNIYLSQLRARKRKSGENLWDLGEVIRDLVSLAYPDVHEHAIGRIQLNSFIDALTSWEMKQYILGRQPNSLENAISFATEWETYKYLNDRDFSRGHARAFDANSSDTDNSSTSYSWGDQSIESIIHDVNQFKLRKQWKDRGNTTSSEKLSIDKNEFQAMKAEIESLKLKLTESKSRNRPKFHCTYCGKDYHTEEKCFLKMAQTKSSPGNGDGNHQ